MPQRSNASKGKVSVIDTHTYIVVSVEQNQSSFDDFAKTIQSEHHYDVVI